MRGAATLKGRALKEVWNIAAVIPIEKGIGVGTVRNNDQTQTNSNNYCEGLDIEENFLGVCNQELLARGRELLKRTRNGKLHKSPDINSMHKIFCPYFLMQLSICWFQVIFTGK